MVYIILKYKRIYHVDKKYMSYYVITFIYYMSCVKHMKQVPTPY